MRERVSLHCNNDKNDNDLVSFGTNLPQSPAERVVDSAQNQQWHSLPPFDTEVSWFEWSSRDVLGIEENTTQRIQIQPRTTSTESTCAPKWATPWQCPPCSFLLGRHREKKCWDFAKAPVPIFPFRPMTMNAEEEALSDCYCMVDSWDGFHIDAL